MRRMGACAWALSAALAIGAMGCGGPDYDHTEFAIGRVSSLGGRVDRSRIEVPEGMIVTAHIVSYNDDDEIMRMTPHSKDPTILDVRPIITEHDFAFVGLKPGVTEVEIEADGHVVLVIAASVVPQP